MKLIKAFAVSTLIGTALCLSPSSQAFWGGEGDPTYENLHRDDYFFSSKTQAKVYETPGWILMALNPRNGDVAKMKLVDCRGVNCTYLYRWVDNPSKDVYAEEVDCMRKKYRVRTHNASWTVWFDVRDDDMQYTAINKFCK